MNPEIHQAGKLWWGVIPAIMIPVAAALVYFVLLAESGYAVIAYGASKVFLLVWPILAIILWESKDFKLSRGEGIKSIKAMPLGIGTGVLIAILILGTFKFTNWADIIQQYSVKIVVKAQDLKVMDHYLPFAILISLGHSLLEEYYWRWYVFGRLGKLVRPTTAYVIASLTFAAHHYVVLGCFFPIWLAALLGAAVALGGGFWCWMYQKQQTLAGCWISHALVDGAIFFLGYQLIN